MVIAALRCAPRDRLPAFSRSHRGLIALQRWDNDHGQVLVSYPVECDWVATVRPVAPLVTQFGCLPDETSSILVRGAITPVAQLEEYDATNVVGGSSNLSRGTNPGRQRPCPRSSAEEHYAPNVEVGGSSPLEGSNDATQTIRGSGMVKRQTHVAHNHAIVGSSPTPATNESGAGRRRGGMSRSRPIRPA